MRSHILLTLGLALTSVSAFAAPKDAAVTVQTVLDANGSAAKETNAGDFVADAVRHAAGADIGLVAADELTDASVAAGPVAADKFNNLLRYADDSSDTVVVLKLTGAQILHALELGVGHAPRPFNGFWQVSGVQVRYDDSLAEGKRVSLAGIGGSEISAGKTYTVATTRPVALGNLGYFRVWSKSDMARDTNVPIAESVKSYAVSQRTVNASVEGRVVAAR